MEECQRIYGQCEDFILVETQELALKEADGLIIVTEGQHFKAPDFDGIINTLNTPVIFDGRNLFEPERLASFGITYYSIGRN